MKLKKQVAAPDNPKERLLLIFFDFAAWVEHKIGNIPFAEVLKNKSRGRK